MPLVQPTFRRVLGIWWSFVWRSFVLWTPLAIIVMVGMLSFIPFPQPGKQPEPDEFRRLMTVFPLIWLLMMAGFVITQVWAMQWMLKSQRWSDYYVALIPVDDPRRDV